MAGLTTHILDVAQGCPAAHVEVELFRFNGEELKFICQVRTNADGRTDHPLLLPEETVPATYEMRFHIGAYFADAGLGDSSTPFLDVVPVRFAIADTDRHYHVPLLVAPWAYSVYRGS